MADQGRRDNAVKFSQKSHRKTIRGSDGVAEPVLETRDLDSSCAARWRGSRAVSYFIRAADL